MMPEQQSLMLYIVMGSGSENGSRLPKEAPGVVFQSEATWLPGNRPKNGSWLPKVAWGAASKVRLYAPKNATKSAHQLQKLAQGLHLQPAFSLQKNLQGGALLLESRYSWRLAGCVSGPHLTSSHDNINSYCDPK